jgi:hypothetical protein
MVFQKHQLGITYQLFHKPFQEENL